jgi:hypothetical protein
MGRHRIVQFRVILRGKNLGQQRPKQCGKPNAINQPQWLARIDGFKSSGPSWGRSSRHISGCRTTIAIILTAPPSLNPPWVSTPFETTPTAVAAAQDHVIVPSPQQRRSQRNERAWAWNLRKNKAIWRVYKVVPHTQLSCTIFCLSMLYGLCKKMCVYIVGS